MALPAVSGRIVLDDGAFVVFLIGMRINEPWKSHKWWPVFSVMPRMLRELDRNPQLTPEPQFAVR